MLRLAVPLASLFLFSGFVVAGVDAPGCTSASWRWSHNSLDQNPCTVAAYLMSTCNGGSFTINALAPGYHYTGPSDSEDADLCKCNTVIYSLLSACEACQGEEWISWPKYTHNCSEVLPSSSFPNPIPYGTRVPYWALIDVTVKDTWDALKAYTIGGTPEAGPGTILAHPIRFIGATKDISHDAKLTGSGSPTASPPKCTSARGSGLNGCAVSGAAVGRVAAFSIICAAIFYLRRRRPRAQSLAASKGDDVHHPQMESTWKSPSDRTPVDTSSLTETLTAMTKPYKSKGSTHCDYV